MNCINAAHKKTPLLLFKRIAHAEHQDLNAFFSNIVSGKTAILKNNRKTLAHPCAVGKGLRTKVNVNLGASTDASNLNNEIKKLDIALAHGADAVMDLSVGKHIVAIRKEILERSNVSVGTVPIYEAVQRVFDKNLPLRHLSKNTVLEVIEEQAQEGVDFFTVHSGITKEMIRTMASTKRLMGIVSRGGALIAHWIKLTNKENPFYEYFDDILSIAKKYDITLSLGDGLRPGSVLDSTDTYQLAELKKLGELALRARKQGVQTIIEGPGHVPLHHIKRNIELQKKLCHEAPFYVLGPLVTDVAPGYDHITSAIGGALAGYYGADFLCYVTPSEHLRLPPLKDVKEGLIAARIAAHAADIAKGIPHQIDWDRKMSRARKLRQWKKQITLSIDPIKARRFRAESKPKESSVCTMCGKFCSIKLSEHITYEHDSVSKLSVRS